MSTAQENEPNVEFPEVIQGDNFLFALVSSSNNEFISNGMEVNTRDIWIISFRQANISSIDYYFDINNETTLRTAYFDYDSVSDRSWLKLNIPEQHNRTRIDIYYNKQIRENVSLPIGFTVFNLTPSGELDANISQGELSLAKMFTGIFAALCAIVGGYLAYQGKKISPLLELPGIIIMSIFFMAGVTVTLALTVGLSGTGTITLYAAMFLMGITFGVWKYEFPTETLALCKVITENQSIVFDIYNVRKIHEDFFELLLPGKYAIMKLFGRTSFIRPVSPINNKWGSPFNYFSFIDELVVNEGKTKTEIEYSAQQLEITKKILEANKYLKSVELNAQMHENMRSMYNKLVVGLTRYTDYLVSSRLYEIMELQPGEEIVEKHKEFKESIENFEIVENWQLRRDIEKEDPVIEGENNEHGKEDNRGDRVELPVAVETSNSERTITDEKTE